MRLSGWPALLCLGGAVLSLVTLASVYAEPIKERTFVYRTEISALTFAQEAEPIANPLHDPQLKYVIPDGVFVEEGSVITEFDRKGLQNHLDNLEQERAIVRAELKETLTNLRNRDLALQDELESLRDRLAVTETQLARFRALPEPDDVAIAKGRLQVARLEYEAAEQDLETARDRFERGMISPGEFDQYERAFREKEARLKHREGILRIASRPADLSTIRRTELNIANIELEIEKLLNEIARNEEISEIERNGANAEVEIIENRILETKADLESAVVRAPVSGHVVYLPMFRRHRGQTGLKMYKDFPYMKIPNPDSLAFKGLLLESERRFFQEGDRVVIRMSSRPGEPIEGEITSLSAMSHDRSEREEARTRYVLDSGIMVYDVLIQAHERPEWLRIGLSAECELIAAEPVKAPSIPATYVKSRNGEFYLSFDGLYQKVEGLLVDGHFLLADPSLMGREADLFGRFPDESKVVEDPGFSGFRASGELLPAETEDVVVGDVYKWQKVSWLVPEDTVVETGEVLIRLDQENTDEAIKQAEATLRQAVSQREREEEELKLRNRENQFNLDRASNLWEIARLDLKDLLDDRETEPLLIAELNLSLAQIRFEFLERKLQRIEGKRTTAFSPLEVAQLKRDLRRAELESEAAQILYDKIRSGPEPAQVCKAELNVLGNQITVSNFRNKLETDRFRKNSLLRRAEREERRRQDILDERYLERDNLVLSAPKGGLVRYGKVRNSGVWSKVDLGSLVSDGARLMKIADVSRMYIRLEVPEEYYTAVREGMRVQLKTRALTDATLEGVVTEIEFLFKRKRRKDSERGLYSSHESLGETAFYVRVEVDEQQGVKLKPGAMAEVIFPFEEPKAVVRQDPGASL